MALQKDMTLNTGLQTIAYFKIQTIVLDYKNKLFSISVNTYVSKTARDSNMEPLVTSQYSGNSGLGLVPPNSVNTKFDDYFSSDAMDGGGNVMHQAYEFLKTLDEFQDAEDV